MSSADWAATYGSACLLDGVLCGSRDNGEADRGTGTARTDVRTDGAGAVVGGDEVVLCGDEGPVRESIDGAVELALESNRIGSMLAITDEAADFIRL